ncbi:hypothetical protein A2454_06655 [Candidatus Peribacteria bacterium RIFOXYC2_FULL_55_14]|nr:MAG: hypothetical protein A2198_04660 [Candidatus Peribacteria bacterium RIFOXYA1_FULL_56_14]OGJ74142.1 MAG: hypothetical protein A2217_00680 [Candidatus Peribacteria bacterium RIFOXYA2_FULL_55_28]OGJ75573.1 MAG: hypothetical protein A2384_01640 [Candidatus Peribacteria bacterium RIFOXYB1_FULL_54_35]OGJ76251.1 MAG: hypothetical protein A2327_00230 [Candidatus Peribacteria bacterium RIFOXYB2_FULL_54_17]OGJ78888.1 MAG: hypothetical protein A2424_06205 [Candidatus Peribacteria bacterium RIFOXYC
MVRKTAIVLMALCFVVLVSRTFGDKTKPKVPSPPGFPDGQFKSFPKAEKPKEGKVDVLFTPTAAQIRVWKAQKWVTVKELPMHPNLERDSAGIPYNHKEMAQYFEWEKEEKPPAQQVIFVIIQQKRLSLGRDIHSGEIVAGMFIVNFYHCLVDPKSATVVKEDAGANVVYFRKQKKEEVPKLPPDAELRKA